MKQYHIGLDSISSCVMGFMLSVTYLNTDLWEAVNVLTFSNHLLKRKLSQYDYSFNCVKTAHQVFRSLQTTDYDVMYQNNKEEVKNMDSLKKFEYLDAKAQKLMNELENVITQSLKESAKATERVDVSDMVNEIVIDNIMLRRMVYQANYLIIKSNSRRR
jgi:hypothetical protein